MQWSAAQRRKADFGKARSAGPAERPARHLRLRGPQGLRRFAGPPPGGRPPSSPCRIRPSWPTWCPWPFGPSRGSEGVAGTADPELYRYGVLGRDFTAYFTVAPAQAYHVRLKFCQAAATAKPGGEATSIDDPRHGGGDRHGHRRHRRRAGQGGGPGLQRHPPRAWRDRRPLLEPPRGQAMVQAIEVAPGPDPGGPGAAPVR